MAYDGYESVETRRRRREDVNYESPGSPEDDQYRAPGPGYHGEQGGIEPEYKPPTPTPAPTSSAPPPVLAGWDQTKWNDPNHNTVKYQAGRIMAKYPPTTAGLAQAWTEIKAAFPNATFNGKDKIDFGDGWGPVDILQGASVGGQAWQWLGQDAAGGGAGAQQGAGAGAPGGAAPGGSAESQAYKSILERLMSQDPTNVSLDDNGLRQSSDAFRADIERSRRDEQAGIAEMMASQGLGQSGAMDAEVMSSWDKAGHQIATHDSELIQGEIKAKRDEMMNALQLYGQFMSEEEQRELQWRISELNATLDRERLGFSYDELEANMNNNIILAMMGKK